MRHANAVGLCFVLGAWGCAVPEESDPGVAPGSPAATPPTEPPPPDLVAWTAAGELAVVDGVTGAVRQRLATTGGGERDVAYDPWRGRVLTFEGVEEGSGEIAAYPVYSGRRGPRLGRRAHQAWIDGRARLLPSPHGAVVFEEGYGERWKLLGASPAPSVLAPPPVSAWLSIGPSGVAVHGLSRDPALVRRAARVSASGLEPPIEETLDAAPASLSSTARLVPAPARGDAVLVDVVGTFLLVRLVAGASAGPAALVPLPARGMRIEAAVPFDDGQVVALLMSGRSEVMAIAVGADGAVTSVAHAPLPGEVTPAPTFFSRDLAAQGEGRVLAATSAGVHALRLQHHPGGVHLGLLGSFDGSALRGPLATLGPDP
jgi:hypothetical protein